MCINCRALMVTTYLTLSDGDVMKGFNVIRDTQMTYPQIRHLVKHPVAFIACHDPSTTQLRVTPVHDRVRHVGESYGLPCSAGSDPHFSGDAINLGRLGQLSLHRGPPPSHNPPNIENVAAQAGFGGLSEVVGLSDFTLVNGVIHSQSSELLGFGPPAELDSAGGIPVVVINLLNTPVNNAAYVLLPQQ